MGMANTQTVMWSVSASGCADGSALAADRHAADAAGVHLCVVTGERGVALAPEELDAQLAALAEAFPPVVLKIGGLAGLQALRVVTQWIDRLRAQRPLMVVVDTVTLAALDAGNSDAELLRACRDALLPRASVITTDRHTAARLLYLHDDVSDAAQPARARALRALGAEAVVISGGDTGGPLSLDRLLTPHTEGWLARPSGTHAGASTAAMPSATPPAMASAIAATLARGFVAADAAVLARMMTATGLPPPAGWVRNPALLPALFDGDAAPSTWPATQIAYPARKLSGVYAISSDAAHVAALFAAGLRNVQLRLKQVENEPAAAWRLRLYAALRQAQAAAQRSGATLIVNDHWRAAIELGIGAVHLGQEDLLALTADDRRQLAAARGAGIHRLRLGISSHSPWELARTRAWAPDYVACGPVWPTTTKAMPWRPQGLHNLGWWVAVAPAPVVGIGGVLQPAQLKAVAASGAAAGCVVRGLAPHSGHTAAEWMAAWAAGSAAMEPAPTGDGWPAPTLQPVNAAPAARASSGSAAG